MQTLSAAQLHPYLLGFLPLTLQNLILPFPNTRSVTPESRGVCSGFVSKVLRVNPTKPSVRAWSEVGEQPQVHGTHWGPCCVHPASAGPVSCSWGCAAALLSKVEIPSCHLLRHREWDEGLSCFEKTFTHGAVAYVD